MTVEEEEKLDDEEDPERLGSKVHDIMMHYAKKGRPQKEAKKEI
jgi:hypothetical protein